LIDLIHAGRWDIAEPDPNGVFHPVEVGSDLQGAAFDVDLP
jgi:hypothetical protein